MSSRSWETTLGDITSRGIVLRREGGHSGVVLLLSWTPDGSQLISICSNCFVKVWDATTYELLHTLGAIEDNSVHQALVICWSPEKDRMGVVFNSCVKFWCVRESYVFVDELRTSNTKHIEWTKDGTHIVTITGQIGFANRICIWCDTTYQLIRCINDAIGFSSRSFALSQCGEKIAYSHTSIAKGKRVEYLTIASMLSDNMGDILYEINRTSALPFTSIIWSPDGDEIATTNSKDIQVWNSLSLSLTHSIQSKCGNIISLSWSYNGNRFTCLSSNNTRVVRSNVAYIQVHSPSDNYEMLCAIECDSNTTDISWTKNSDRFISRTDDMTIRIWDAVCFRILHTLEGNSILLNCSTWFGDGEIVAMGGNDRITIWNTETGCQVACIRFREMLLDDTRGEIMRKCPQCRKEIPSPFGYKGYPDNAITCGICYEEFSPIMMTVCGHFLCDICFRNPMVFGHSGANVVDDLASSLRGVSLSPREEEYVPYNIFRDVFVIYGRHPNPPESRDGIETSRRKDVIINALKKHNNDQENHHISAQVVMDLTFYCDPPRDDYPFGFMSPDEQSTHSFRRSVSIARDVPDWQTAIISLYSDLVRRIP